MKNTRIIHTLIALASSLSLYACGGDISGVYEGTGNSPYEKIDIQGGGDANIIVNSAVTLKGTYKLTDNDGLIINFQGIDYTFDIKDACIEGMLGEYCK